MATGGRRAGWPLQGYCVAVGVMVTLAGVAAGGYVYVQWDNDAKQSATADAKFAAGKAATELASGLDVIQKTSTALTASRPTMETLFSKPALCQLGYAPLGGFDTGRVEFIRADGSVICSSRSGMSARF